MVRAETEVEHEVSPLHDRVVVRHIDAEERTAAGIISPRWPGRRDDTGKLVAIALNAVVANLKQQRRSAQFSSD